jgi:ubiquinone/menaquinone biosynthesis C-methylase UbiE
MERPDVAVSGESLAVVAEYDRLAGRYDIRWKHYISASTQATASRIAVAADARLLDVGCGTGALLRRLCARQPKLRCSGLDPSTAMLDRARRELPDADLKQGFAESLPWPDGTFDLVASCNAFHFFSDPAQALREMARVLRPDGSLIITDWCDDFLVCRLCDMYLRLVNSAHRRIHSSTACRTLLQDGGWRGVRLERFKISWLWGLMTAEARRPDAASTDAAL